MLSRMLTLVALVVITITASVASILYTWTNGQPASHVLCQSTFTTSTTGAGLNTCAQPFDAILDRVTHKVYVADVGNNRVLRFTNSNR